MSETQKQIEIIREYVSSIRGDWTNPKYECNQIHAHAVEIINKTDDIYIKNMAEKIQKLTSDIRGDYSTASGKCDEISIVLEKIEKADLVNDEVAKIEARSQ